MELQVVRVEYWLRGGKALPLFLLSRHNREEELELRRELVLRVEPIGKVDATDTAVGVDLHTKRLNVVCAVSPAREVGQVELNLVPPFVQSHWHGANERLHSRRGLVIRCTESSAHVLIVEDLDFEREVLFEVLDDHDQEWQLYPQCLIWVHGTCDIVGADIGANDF